MWNYIKGFFRSGSFIRKLAISLIGFSGLLLFFALLFTGKMKSVELGVFISFFLGGQYKLKFGDQLKDIEHVPYWGNKFGRETTIELLDGEIFRPYVMSTGQKCRFLKVSKNNRWFCVAGHYYPLYLVRGLDEKTGDLLMIDGTRLTGQRWLNNSFVKKAVIDLFKANRIYEKGLTSNAIDGISASAFARVTYKDYHSLARSDWDQIRYKWEIEVAEMAADHLDKKRYGKFKNALDLPEYAREALWTRVLTDDEMNVIIKAYEDRHITDLIDWFEIDNFKDDMCICSGVHLLRRMGAIGEDKARAFLFDCIRDIQKPYFEEAVEALSRYHRDTLIEEIEKHVSIAHETGDVLFGAGLIYLSKKIGYEISLIREQEAETYKAFRHPVSAGVAYAQSADEQYTDTQF